MLIDEGRSALISTPFINKLGEQFDKKTKVWKDYSLIKSDGSFVQVLQDVKKLLIEGKLASEIIKDRLKQQQPVITLNAI